MATIMVTAQGHYILLFILFNKQTLVNLSDCFPLKKKQRTESFRAQWAKYLLSEGKLDALSDMCPYCPSNDNSKVWPMLYFYVSFIPSLRNI